jgi:CubicO group peptidase (beta-lactamase class C family)
VPARWGLGIQRRLFPELPCSSHIYGHGGGSIAHVWVDTEHRLSVAGVVSGLPAGPGETARWRQELAAAVYQDLALPGSS